MNVINSVTTALLEYYITLTVLLEYIGILCQFSKPDWFLETCETPLELPLLSERVEQAQQQPIGFIIKYEYKNLEAQLTNNISM